MCPICGSKLKVQRWYEEVGFVETDKQCNRCGYHNSDSYGRNEISFGNFNFYFSYSIPLKEYIKIEKRMDKARWSYRKYLLRTGVIKGKKYSKYF